MGAEAAFHAELGEGWQIGGGINGGMLLALAGRSLSEAFATDGHGDPFTISAYYLSASTPGPARLAVQRLRTGSTLTTGQVSLTQPNSSGEPVERLRALATLGHLDQLDEDVRTSAVAPDLPPPEECLASSSAPPDFLETAQLLNRFDLRLDPATAGWAVGQPSGQGVIQGWLRLADPREPDPIELLLACDALPPVTFDFGLYGWAPTLELTVHVRARPAPGWLLVRHATRNFAGGLLEEDGEVWDSTGRLVAQSRQLAMAPRSTARRGGAVTAELVVGAAIVHDGRAARRAPSQPPRRHRDGSSPAARSSRVSRRTKRWCARSTRSSAASWRSESSSRVASMSDPGSSCRRSGSGGRGRADPPRARGDPLALASTSS